jgi:transposase-like protein
VTIQSVSGYTPPVASQPGDSITELARQHGVSRESLLELVQTKIQQAREANGQPPLDQATLDQVLDHRSSHTDDEGEAAGAPAYTATAQLTAERPRTTGSISILA